MNSWPVIVEKSRTGFFRARWYSNSVGSPVEGRAAGSAADALRNLADALDVEGKRQAVITAIDTGGDAA